MEDNPLLLMKAKKYLEKHQEALRKMSSNSADTEKAVKQPINLRQLRQNELNNRTSQIQLCEKLVN